MKKKIIAIKIPRLRVKIGDVVSFAFISNRKLHKSIVHKIVNVRYDLIWKDVLYKYCK